MESYANELKRRETITDIVKSYDCTVDHIRQAFVLFGEAVEQWKNVANHFPSEIAIKNYHCNDKQAADAKKKLMEYAWRDIIQRTQMTDAMTEKRRKEMDQQIDSGQMPEFTVENIMDILASLYGRSNELMSESIQEAFQTLRPRSVRHKTNSQYEIPKKVILSGVITHWVIWGINQYWDQPIQTIDNAFSMLDGQGVSRYPGKLVTAIQESLTNRTGSFRTEYFDGKCYPSSGTLHLSFRRLDLLEKLNQIAGGKRLKK